MSVHQVREKAETAFKTVIENAGVSADAVYTSFQDQESTMDLPAVSVGMVNAVEEPFGLGNYRAQVGIEIMTSAAKDSTENPTPKTTHANLVSAVIDALKVDDLATQLSDAVTAFSVMGEPLDRGLEPPETDGRIFRDAIIFEIYCAPNDFT